MIIVKSIPSYGTRISAHNDMFFVVDSTNKALTNFKYVFDVYVDAALVARVKVFPDPQYQYGLLNVGPIIRSYLNSLHFEGRNQFMTAKSADGYFKKSYQIKYGEEYGTPPTIYTNLVTSTTYTAYNYYNSILQNSLTARLDGFENNFLRTQSTPIKVSLSDNYFINYWNTSLFRNFTISTYNAAGTKLDEVDATGTSELLEMNIGPLGINATFGMKITDQVSYYIITYGFKRSLRIDIDCWPKYPNQTLVFLNRLGGYETAHFRFKSRRTISTEKKTFGRVPWQINADGSISFNIGTSNVLRGTEQTYSVRQANKYKLSSDILNDDGFQFHAAMFGSPQVYMEFKTISQYGNLAKIITEGGVDIITEDGLNLVTETDIINYFMQNSAAYVPVKISQNDYSVRTVRADGLQALELEVELMQQYNSQFQ
jgi:hypothetical protein